MSARIVATLDSRSRCAPRELPAAVGFVAASPQSMTSSSFADLRAAFARPLIFALTPPRLGGPRPTGDAARRLLLAAAAECELVELEEQDADPVVLAAIPPERRILATVGTDPAPDRLRAAFDRIARIPARYYRVGVAVDDAVEERSALELLAALDRRDTVSHAWTTAGSWSQLLAPHLGAPLVYAALDDEAAGGGLWSVSRLVRDYGFDPSAPRPSRLFGIVGGAVGASLSPRLHNTGYRHAGIDALYLPFSVGSFAAFWRQIATDGFLRSVGMPLCGATVVAPHKDAASELADERDTLVASGAGTNVIRRDGASWFATTTDRIGVLAPLRRRGLRLAGARLAVVGCGGTGRALALALDAAGADVTVVNRTPARGEAFAAAAGLPFLPLARFRAADFAIVVHATPVGKSSSEALFPVDDMAPDATVVDMVYAAKTTCLIDAARGRGLDFVDGYEVLREQTRAAFLEMTSHALADEVLDLHLAEARDRAPVAAGPIEESREGIA